MTRPKDSRILSPLREAAAKGKDLRYCVVGAGNGGLAMAGHLGIMGFQVSLYNRTDERLTGVRWHGGIQVEGAVNGVGPIALATSNMEEALREADVVRVVTPSTAHGGL